MIFGGPAGCCSGDLMLLDGAPSAGTIFGVIFIIASIVILSLVRNS